MGELYKTFLVRKVVHWSRTFLELERLDQILPGMVGSDKIFLEMETLYLSWSAK